ncbi:MAG TPA: DUF962 domain-containing protein [Polyangia bacterium]|nr:DUF962 domain-containing protein [Polyangia bacterium]
MAGRIETFEEFWPFYLGEHARPGTRALHIAGSTVGLVAGVLAAVLRMPALLLVALAAGYAFSWISHATIEHNRPATFTHPLWSFAADWKMWALAVTGRLGRELERAGVRPRPASGGRGATGAT